MTFMVKYTQEGESVAHLINVKPTHVSYVDKAANKRTILMTKAQDKSNYEKTVKFIKGADDEAKKLVYAVVYEPEVEDTDGDKMTADEIEKASHEFMMSNQSIDRQHDFVAGAGQLMESYIAPVDFKLGEQLVTKGTWVMVTKASDEIWDGIQNGEITGYSMAGTAERIEDEPKITKSFLEKCVGAVLKSLNVKKESEDILDMTPDELKKLVADTVAQAFEDHDKKRGEEGPHKEGDNKNDDKQKLDLTDAQAEYLANEEDKINKAVKAYEDATAKMVATTEKVEKMEKAMKNSRVSNALEQIKKSDEAETKGYVNAIFGGDE